MNSTNFPGAVAPLVSVVMCFLDPAPAYFQEAVESLQNQTYPKWELLLLDDGTTNGAENLARNYATSPQIRYAKTAGGHCGPASARNQAVQMASGELIAFLDADDFWLPEKLSQQVQAMESHPTAALSYGGILRWYNLANTDVAEVHTETLESFQPREILRSFLRNECVPGMSSVMVRREAFRTVGGFEESLRWAEDQTISYKIGLRYKCLLLPGWQVKYRQHDASTTSRTYSDRRLFSNHLHFLSWIADYFRSEGVSDAVLWSDLRRLRRQYRWLAFQEKWVPRQLKAACRRLF